MSATEKVETQKAETQKDHAIPAFADLFAAVAAFGVDSPEAELMVAAVRESAPGLLERGLELRAQQNAKHWAKLDALEVERATRRAEFDAEVRERGIRQEQSLATYTARLVGGLNEVIEQIRSDRTSTPCFEPVDERWIAVLDDGCVLGVGSTRDDAYAAAIGHELDVLADPARAIDAHDDLPATREDVERILDTLGLRFVHLVADAPLLTHIIRTVDGTTLVEIMDGGR